MPHKIVNGMVTRSDYGNRPQVTRIAGFGNGGLNVDLTPETIEEIMEAFKFKELDEIGL
jgi:hypothetical protein